MKRTNHIQRAAAVLLSLLLCAQTAAPALAADSRTIYIDSAGDLLALAAQCSLDTWSRDKTVVLRSDISLGSTDYTPIPTFGGTFDGGGHTISGLNLSGNLSPAGLFGVLQEGAVVRDLRVSGTVQPTGGSRDVGGIAGCSGGLIENCAFSGTVSGKDGVGGIVGTNALTGTIRSCTAAGSVTGSSRTGGITGVNLGVVSSCRNDSYVNITSVDPGINLSDLDLTPSAQLLTLRSLDTINVATDTGGIAGYSSGMLLSCVNTGIIGYQHVGYNVGGIAGRSCGYAAHCVNYGQVLGRKDIGGIVGQAEPYVVLNFSEDTLETLRSQLNTLQRLVDRTADNAEDSSTDLSNRLSAISGVLDTASGHAEDLTDQLSDYGDGVISEINRGSDILADALDQLSAISEQVTDLSGPITKSINKLETAARELVRVGDASSGAMDTLQGAAGNLTTASGLLKSGLSDLSDGTKQLRNAVETRDEAAARQALAQIKKGLEQLPQAMDLISKALDTISGALSDAKTASDALTTAAKQLAEALDILGDVSADGQDILSDAEDLLDFLSSADPIQIAHPDEAISTSADALYDTLHLLNSHVDQLSGAMEGTAHTLSNDVRAISSQFHSIMNTVLDAVDDLENTAPEDRFSDASQADIDAVTSGKLLSCDNRAAVSGDINTGGVAGTIAVEYELDPESDALSGDAPLYRREYELKAILQNCSNTGTITGRRDYVGGICGRMDLGLITGCEGGGIVESESGDYIGGIAGFTTAAIRDSFAKCRLSGGKYVGGIVGSAAVEGSAKSVGEVSRCHSLVRVTDAKQYVGAISGVDRGAFRDNTFVSDQLAGIGGISIAGKAEPVSYETLLKTPGLPISFQRLTLRFLARDQVLKTVFFHYGDSLDDSVFPDIPAESGSYAVWDLTDLSDLRFDTDVTAVYAPCVSTLSSESQRDDGRPVFLVEGQFNDRDQLAAERSARQSSAVRRTPDSIRKAVEQWQLTIPADGQEAHTVRYLSPSGKTDKLEVYALLGGKWERLDTDTVGSYLRFDLPEGGSSLAVVSCTSIWWLWLLGAVACAGLAAVLLLRRRAARKAKAALPTQTQAPVPAPRPSGKRRALRLVAGALVLLALCTAWFFGSGAKDRLVAYHLLHKYVQRTELSMELTADVDVGQQHFTVCTELTRTKAEGQRVTRAEQYGVPLYYSNGLVYTENGKSFSTGSIFPDYSTLLDNAEALYRAARVSVYENSGETIYSITVTDKDAESLLTHLFPAAVQSIAVQDVDIDLISSGGELSGIRFSAGGALSGTPADISLNLSIRQSVQPPEIPQAVRQHLRDDGTQAEQLPAGDLLHLMTAWMKLNAEDPFSAQLSLSANCGPLVLDDQLELYRTRRNGMQVSLIRKNGRTWYFTDSTICGEDGSAVSAADADVTRSAALVVLAGRLCMNGSLVRTERDGGEVYTLSLDQEGLDAVAGAILPQLHTLDATLTSGSIRIVLKENAIQSIRFTCDGSAHILLSDVPIFLSGELMPGAAAEMPVIPDAVLSTLQKGE